MYDMYIEVAFYLCTAYVHILIYVYINGPVMLVHQTIDNSSLEASWIAALDGDRFYLLLLLSPGLIAVSMGYDTEVRRSVKGEQRHFGVGICEVRRWMIHVDGSIDWNTLATPQKTQFLRRNPTIWRSPGIYGHLRTCRITLDPAPTHRAKA